MTLSISRSSITYDCAPFFSDSINSHRYSSRSFGVYNANEPLEEIRARFAIQPKSPRILELDPVGATKLPPGN